MPVYYPECRINIQAVFDGFGGPDQPTILTDIIPYSANIHLNSYKEADTWEVTFDAKKFPFSPELLKSADVEIYLYLKPNQTTGELDNPYGMDDSRNLLVKGLVDQATLTEDTDGGKVSLSGRDYTALLIDRQWDPTESGRGGKIPEGELDKVLQELVDEAVLAKKTGQILKVQYIDETTEVIVNDVNATVVKKKVTTPKTTKSKSRKKRGVAVKADSTYWDVMYKLCLSYGFIVYVKGLDVVVSKPHVLQDIARTQYKVAYGRNLEKLEVERKLSKEAVPQIVIRSYDSKNKKVIEGKYPEDGKKTVGVNIKKEEFKVFAVPDVKDTKTLQDIAKTTYYTIARGEGVIRFSTPQLTDLENVDLTKIRSGDSVEIKWDAFDHQKMEDSSRSKEEKVSILLSLGYAYDIANLVADQYAKLDYFRQPFYVKEVNITWDKDRGCSIDVEAMNFINPAQSA